MCKRSIRVYDAANGELTIYLCVPENQPDLTCAMLSKNHRKLFLGDANGRVKVYNSTCFLQIGKLRPEQYLQDSQQAIGALSICDPINQAPEMLISVNWEDHMTIFDAQTGTEIKSTNGVVS